MRVTPLPGAAASRNIRDRIGGLVRGGGGRAGRLVMAGAVVLLVLGLSLPAVTGSSWRSPLGPAVAVDAVKGQAQSAASKGARNVILMIGDGLGDPQITIARDYEYGADGRLPGIDALPMTGQYTTHSIYRDGPYRGLPDYTTDSAAAASGWATGVKTYDGALSVDVDGAPRPTLLELAKDAGLRTGNVSTAAVFDATPAALVAHITARGCIGPVATTTFCPQEALENGGRGSVAEQLLQARADVTLGGGSDLFAETARAGDWEGMTLAEQAVERGYQMVTTADELAAVTAADGSAPLLGLLAPGNLPTRWSPTAATPGGAGGEPLRCTENPDRLADVTLADLTARAIALLDVEGSNGFFLQVEGASIDKVDHSASACGQIGETLDLDAAVQVALAFARKDGETLLLLTGDHGQSAQIVDGVTPGLGTTLLTNEGAPLRIAYGTAEAGGSQQHTGSQIRLAAFGPSATEVTGLSDQTQLFGTIADALGLPQGGF